MRLRSPLLIVGFVVFVAGVLIAYVSRRRPGDDDVLVIVGLALMTLHFICEDMRIIEVHKQDARKAKLEARGWDGE